MAVFMEYTEISTLKTAGEIQGLLAGHGARAVSIEYDPDGDPCAIEFRIMQGNLPLQFRLPARWAGVLKLMQTQKKRRRRSVNEAQAKRTAWRQVLRWTEAQLALIETESAEVTEVFLPYLIVDSKGTTFYEKALASGDFPALPAPKEG